MEIICIENQFWWASRFVTKGQKVGEVLDFITEVLTSRPYTILNTGGHSAPHGLNPHTNPKFVDQNFSDNDRKKATKAKVKTYVNECSPKKVPRTQSCSTRTTT